MVSQYFRVPLVVFIDRAKHHRPGCLYHKEAPGARRYRLPVFVHYVSDDTGTAFPANPGRIGSPTMVVIMCIPVFSLPPGIKDRATILSYGMMVPDGIPSGFRGSPTDPITRRELRSYLSGHFSPIFMNIRIAVGAV